MITVACVLNSARFNGFGMRAHIQSGASGVIVGVLLYLVGKGNPHCLVGSHRSHGGHTNAEVTCHRHFLMADSIYVNTSGILQIHFMFVAARIVSYFCTSDRFIVTFSHLGQLYHLQLQVYHC